MSRKRVQAAWRAHKQSLKAAGLIQEIAEMPFCTDSSRSLEQLRRERLKLERLDEIWKAMPPRIVPRRSSEERRRYALDRVSRAVDRMICWCDDGSREAIRDRERTKKWAEAWGWRANLVPRQVQEIYDRRRTEL